MRYIQMSNRQVRMLLLVGMIAVCPGCGGPSAAEDADFQNLFKTVGKLCEQLNKVNNATSAKAAKDKLDKLEKAIRDLQLKVKAMPDSHRKELYETHTELVDEAQNKLSEQYMRQNTGELPNIAFHYLIVLPDKEN